MNEATMKRILAVLSRLLSPADLALAHVLLNKEFEKDAKDPDSIFLEWTPGDVLAECPGLTREEACRVLSSVEHDHDASLGVNWDRIRRVAERLFPDRDLDAEPEDEEEEENPFDVHAFVSALIRENPKTEHFTVVVMDDDGALTIRVVGGTVQEFEDGDADTIGLYDTGADAADDDAADTAYEKAAGIVAALSNLGKNAELFEPEDEHGDEYDWRDSASYYEIGEHEDEEKP